MFRMDGVEDGGECVQDGGLVEKGRLGICVRLGDYASRWLGTRWVVGEAAATPVCTCANARKPVTDPGRRCRVPGRGLFLFSCVV